MTTLEDRRTLVSSGTNAGRLRTIAASRPFTQQVDVVFPTCPGLEESLAGLDFTYQACESTLMEFLEFAGPYARQSNITALGYSNANDDDVWCLDARGVVTLVVGKGTYETLGIVGDRLPWKECSDMYVIHICLGKSVRPGQPEKWPTYGTKEAAAIRRLDAHKGTWKITYHVNDADGAAHTSSLAKRLVMSTSHSAHTHVPTLRREDLVFRDDKKDLTENWEESVSALFEWVGMAGLGSQRLSEGDRCDPYVSVYEPPELSHAGDLTTMRWTGFITSTALKKILEIILSPNIPSPSFVSVIVHAIPTSPITYLPGSYNVALSLRAPRPEAEDTLSLVYVREERPTGETGCWWLLAESVGRWDKRWG
ncbi:hypothetical protein V8D89_009747 [Ganoderma adspersum]